MQSEERPWRVIDSRRVNLRCQWRAVCYSVHALAELNARPERVFVSDKPEREIGNRLTSATLRSNTGSRDVRLSCFWVKVRARLDSWKPGWNETDWQNINEVVFTLERRLHSSAQGQTDLTIWLLGGQKTKMELCNMYMQLYVVPTTCIKHININQCSF